MSETFCLCFTYTEPSEPGVLVPLQLTASEEKCYYFSGARWKEREPSARRNSWPLWGAATPKESQREPDLSEKYSVNKHCVEHQRYQK